MADEHSRRKEAEGVWVVFQGSRVLRAAGVEDTASPLSFCYLLRAGVIFLSFSHPIALTTR